MSALPIRRRPSLSQISRRSTYAIAAAFGAGLSFGLFGLASAASDPAGLPQGTKASANPGSVIGGNAQRTTVNLIDKNIPAIWNIEHDKKTNIKWVAKLGSRALGGPIVSGGRVFVGTNNGTPREAMGILMCFREADGGFLWEAPYPPTRSELLSDNPNLGMTSTPAVVGNRLYYLTSSFDLVCADTEQFGDGKNGRVEEKHNVGPNAAIVWRLDLKKELGIVPHPPFSGSPLVVGDLIYLITGNGVDGGHLNIPAPGAPSFIAVNRNSGKVVWKDNSPSAKFAEGLAGAKDKNAYMRRLQSRGEKILHSQSSSPAFGVVDGKPQVIFPGGDGWVYSFDPLTGRLIWRFDCNPKDAIYLLGGKGTRSEIIATPFIYNNKVYIGVGQEPEHGEGVGHLWCIDMTRTGDVSPEVVVDASKDPPVTVPNKNNAKVWHYGGPARDVERGYLFGRTLSTCAVHDGLVYAVDLGGFLHCLDARTGHKYWEQDLKGAVWGSPYWVDNKVYIGTEEGDVWVIAHGEEKKVIGTIKMNDPIHSSLVAANGVLYVMTDTHLYAIASP